MADGQMWTLPAPGATSDGKTGPTGSEFTGLIIAVKEAESESDRLLAELALAIFLLAHNYSLSPADYEELLGFEADSPQLTDWQIACHRIVREHLESVGAATGNSAESQPVQPAARGFARLWVWLRNYAAYRWRIFDG
jgi:hypothetical protein